MKAACVIPARTTWKACTLQRKKYKSSASSVTNAFILAMTREKRATGTRNAPYIEKQNTISTNGRRETAGK